MTRRSVVGPLLLIGVGILFLLHNLRPDMPLARVIALYWPYLLIAWGGLRLLEILFLASRRKPYPPGLGGGEIAAVVLICIFGSAMHSFHRHFAGGFTIGPIGPRAIEIFGEGHEYPVEADQSAAGVKRIRIELGRGNAKIIGGEGDRIRVTGNKTVRALSRSEADEFEKQVPFEIAAEGERAVLRFKEREGGPPGRFSADLEVHVPRTVSVETAGRYGDFDISGISGNIQVDSDNAGVRISEAGGNVRVDVRRSDIVRATGVKGNVELNSRGTGGDIELINVAGQVRVNGSFGGTLQFENLAKGLTVESRSTELRVEALPGRITMDLGDITATRLVGPVRLVTRSPDVRIEDVTNMVEVETHRGDIQIRPGRVPLPRVEARSRSGNIELALPANSSFELEATTRRGEARNDFGGGLQVVTDGPSASIRGKVGRGPSINLSTERGSVSIRKAELQLPETRL